MNQSIDRMLEYHQAARHYPGALVLIEEAGKTLCRRESGLLYGHDETRREPMNAQSSFRVASLTKPMVSAVAMMLVDAGRLSLATPVAKILPELAEMRLAAGRAPARPPTIQHLLTHTAGLQYAPDIADEVVRRQALAAGLGELPGMTREAFLSALASLPLQAEPGTRFQYGYSTDVLGLVLERIVGASLGTLMAEHLFRPLAMSTTTFRADPALHASMPTAFADDIAWHRFSGQFETVERELHGMATASGPAGPLESAGGGLITTLDDLARFARFMASRGRVDGKALLSDQAFDAMVHDQLGPAVDGPTAFTGGGWGFGLGGAVRHGFGAAAVPAAAGEFSWSGVTGQSLYIDPARAWFAIMLSANTASRVNVRFEFRRAAASY